MATIVPVVRAIERAERYGKGFEPLRERLALLLRVGAPRRVLGWVLDSTSDFIARQNIHRCLKPDATEDDVFGFLEMLGCPSSGPKRDHCMFALFSVLREPALRKVDMGGLLPWIAVSVRETARRELLKDIVPCVKKSVLEDEKAAVTRPKRGPRHSDEAILEKLEGSWFTDTDLVRLVRVSSRPEREQREIDRRCSEQAFTLEDADKSVPYGLSEDQFRRWQRKNAARHAGSDRLPYKELRAGLKQAGLTQQEVARRLDVSRQSVSAWLNGRSPIPDDRYAALAGLLRM